MAVENPNEIARGTPPPSLARLAASGALVTMGSQVAKIAVQFGGIVLLARLLTPRDYGLVAMVVAIIGVGEVLRDFGLSSAAIQAKNLSREQRDNLFWINSGIGLLLAAAVFLGAGAIADFYREPLLRAISQAISVTLLLNGLTTQFRAHLNRDMRFGPLALADVGGQLLGLAAAVATALLGWGYWALVVQALVQALVILVLMAVATRWLPGLPRRSAGMGGLLRFGGNLMASQLLNYLSTNIGQIIIGSRLGPAPLGHYNRAFALLMMPLTQLNAPATTVALPILSRLQGDRERYSAFLLRGQATLMHFIIAIFAMACAQAGPLILLVLGQRWQMTVPIFQILVVGGVFQAAGYAAYWVFLSKGLTGAQLYYAIVSRTLVIACIAIGSQWGVLGVATGYACGLALSWPLVLWWLSRVSDAPVRQMLVNGLRAMAGYGLCAFASYMASAQFAAASLSMQLGVGIATAVVAFAVLCAVWPAFRRDVVDILHTRTFFRSAKAMELKR
ncbi:lipopolysaccharide biosynthesis protein [Pseudoxanthomonas sp. UTMC 1351]|uniref:lipopolysaccharide biosynthesis protein n=1 Tax=Pseudoxanthomonas sp. UTMC 1351 TaxID=2695853 RepID=UPI0034CE29F4